MKYLTILWANLRRKKLRTLLTMGSFAVALFLFGILAVVRGAFHQGVDVALADRLIVINRTSLIQPLPVSYQQRILQVPGVKTVSYATWFGGVYQDEKNFFPIMAIDHETYFSVLTEFTVPEDQWKTFAEDREGALAGEDLVRRFGWKIGDRIPIQGTIFPGAWEFNLRGVLKPQHSQDVAPVLLFRNDYLNERKPFQKDMVGWYVLRTNGPADATRVGKAIDAMFANSPWETKTEAESSFAASWVAQMGNVEFLILSIGGVVFFTLLLVTGNTMSIAVRERVRELAVLKAVGFADATLLLLVLAESLLIALLGGGAGLALAKAFTLRGDPTGGMLPFFYLPPSAILYGMALALAIGAISGAAPAVSAMRLRVVDALRRV